MKPPIIPSLERGKTHQITFWKSAQIGRQENKHTPGLGSSKTKIRSKQATRRHKLGVKKSIDQLALQEALGFQPRSSSNSNNAYLIHTCKKFGNKLEPKKKFIFRCATQNTQHQQHAIIWLDSEK